MEPKKKQTTREENGYRETRQTYHDSDINMHVEEVRIEPIEDDPRKEDPSQPETLDP